MRRPLLVGAIALAMGVAPFANAALIELSIAPTFDVTPGIPVQIPATITNETGSTISFVNFDARFNPVTNVLSPQNGDTFAGATESYPANDPNSKFLTYTFGPSLTANSVPFSEQFNDVVIPSGDSFSFVAATVQLSPGLPIGGTLFPLTYTFETTTYSPDPPVVVVSNGVQFSVRAVPEPNTLALFAPAIICLGFAWWRRWLRAVRDGKLTFAPSKEGSAIRLSVFAPILGLAAVCISHGALASMITVYSSRSDWDAATSNVVNLDFGPLNTNGPTRPGCVTCGFTDLGTGPVFLGPISFTGTGQTTYTSGPNAGLVVPNDLFANDPSFSCGCTINATSLESLGTGTSTNPADAFTINGGIRIDLPNRTVAFGINLDNIDSDPRAPFTITLSTGDIYQVVTPIDTSAFFGFVSRGPKVDEIDITEGPLLGPFALESPSFARVPEPSSLLLLASAFVGFCFSRGKASRSFTKKLMRSRSSAASRG